jgi:hypothetical protein
MTNRGLVIALPFTTDAGAVSVQPSFARASLRQYLLYWDKLDWPDNDRVSIRINNDDDLNFLQKAGILQRSMVELGDSVSSPAEAMLRAQTSALETLNQADPGAWSLAQHAAALASVAEGTAESCVMELLLDSALPVPIDDTPIEDVLEFKERRRAELLRLQAAMDDIYFRLSEHDTRDVPRARLRELDLLDAALRDLHSAFADSFARRLLSSMKIELSVPSIAATALAGAVVGSTFALPLAAGAAFGAIAAAVKFEL